MSGHGFRGALERLLRREELHADEVEGVMESLLTGALSAAATAGFLIALRAKGETIREIAAAARVMRRHALKVQLAKHINAVDTCGTGGDQSGTFNLSTGAALLAAAAGATVAKHGNRAVSSRSGSADVLEALGVHIDLPPEELARCAEEVGVTFMFAPAHHAATRHAVAPRRDLGVRTLFNLLGPLTNPAGVRRQVLGVYDPEWVEPLAHVLLELGAERALVVHGDGGLDELSLSGPSRVAELRDGVVRIYTLSPEELGLQRAPIGALAGGDAAHNAGILRSVFDGKKGPQADGVALSAGAALYVAGVAESVREGVALAQAALKDGRGRWTLDRLVEHTQRRGAALATSAQPPQATPTPAPRPSFGDAPLPRASTPVDVELTAQSPADEAPRPRPTPPPARDPSPSVPHLVELSPAPPLPKPPPARDPSPSAPQLVELEPQGSPPPRVAPLPHASAPLDLTLEAPPEPQPVPAPLPRPSAPVTVELSPPAPSTAALTGFLAQVNQRKEAEVLALLSHPPTLQGPASRSLSAALRGSRHPGVGLAIIAEIKRRSPSLGALRPDADAGDLAQRYARAGAAAISVLTDGPDFGGKLSDLAAVRARVGVPALRKDFLIHPIQLEEARGWGADAALLIVAMLGEARLRDMLRAAEQLGLEALVEVHDADELRVALRAEARIIGVNARDLKTLTINSEGALGLIRAIPEGVLRVAESGLSSRDDLRRAADAGADAALIGTALMRAPDPGAALAALLGG
ncbi:MAG: anthranilate phosphoribosyltransferase [Deltaproteobacteria bacterium]|nr:anthranilate phosphoribosyltransferase [Deltaproteobacteria bacterium]